MFYNFLALLTTLFPIALSSATEFGPSILSLIRPTPTASFPSLDTQHSFVPHSIHKHNDIRRLHLDKFTNYATVLPISEKRPWIKSEDLIQYIGKESLGSTVPFVVIPPEGHGIMVVIQELQIPAHNTFNRSLLVVHDNGMIMECFSYFKFQIEGKSPVRVCGRTDDHERYRPSVMDGVGPRSFTVPEGRSITVSFSYRDEEIDMSPLLSKQVPFYDMGYLFRGSIAFTAYKPCPQGPPFKDASSNSKLWPCHVPHNNREPVSACIKESLFCDHVINCGIHDFQEFAIDERFCIEEFSNTSTSSSRGKVSFLNTERIEEAVKTRHIMNINRPFGYNDMIMPQGAHFSRPGSTPGSDMHTNEPMEKFDSLSHPAFVALVVLISIICVLIIGLIFRFCCKSCVGKLDPYGDSSNPEAVARFHDNLRSRDNESNARHGRGRPYGISFDSLFKPADDLPPSYDDLFPRGDLPTPTKTITTSATASNSDASPELPASSPSTSSNSGSSGPVLQQQQQRSSPVATRSIFRLPAIIQHTSRAVNRTNNNLARNSSNSNNNSTRGNTVTETGCFINPTFVNIEVVSGSSENASGRSQEIPGRSSDNNSDYNSYAVDRAISVISGNQASTGLSGSNESSSVML